MPDTVENFGINEDNREEFVSERDYAFIHPLNGKYGKWVRDRVSALTVFAPFKERFAPTHFHLVARGDEVLFIPLTSAAREVDASVSGTIELIRGIGSLTLVSSVWKERHRTVLTWNGAGVMADGVLLNGDALKVLLAEQVDRGPCVMVQESPSESAFAQRFGCDDALLRVTLANPGGSRPRIAEAELLLDGSGSEPLHARVDPNDGSFDGARCIAAGKLRSITTHPGSGARITGGIEGWEQIRRELIKMCRFAPQLEFVRFEIIPSTTGDWLIAGISDSPEYSQYFPFSSDSVKFLMERVRFKHEATRGVVVRLRKWLHNLKLWLRKRFAAALYPAGLVPYQSVRWLGDLRRDLMERNGIPLKSKLWAHRNGFLSYRVPQYGITPQNRESFISDLEYRWLRHVNTHYRYWLEDKISIKYVAAEFNECLPGYYFYTALQGGVNHVVPMMDCPEGYEASFDGILELARSRGALALKPDEGSHGDGFFKLEYLRGKYSLNGRAASEAEVLRILTDRHNQYLVTEFIEMHPELSRIYPHSVNTIRVIIFKQDGITPEIGNAYLRIGSLRSGFVDNTAAGGMLAEIDTESGRFGNAQILRDGHVQPSPHHPDTGVLIEGQLPNWEYAKRKVLEIAAALPQLEYLGFDLALTPTGIKLPEINRFPDYPRIERLTPRTTEYLLGKLAQKKARYGYDRIRPRRLITLPTRQDLSAAPSAPSS